MTADMEQGNSRFAIYISHSWHPRDVELNLRVWGELSEKCELLVDAPEDLGAAPPYYINRIEELLRRADFFLGVLTRREPLEGEFSAADAYLRCSPYSVFEIRLAERADMPRLILYERSTGFRPPRNLRPWEAYVPFDRGAKDRLPEQHQWSTVIQKKISLWKAWAFEYRQPISYEQSTTAVVLLGDSSLGPPYAVLAARLEAGGFRPVGCNPETKRSSEAFRMLREAGLVVAEFGPGGRGYEQLYAAAHGLGLPAIRMLQQSSGAQPDLPWILQGDPGGYQNDIVKWSRPEELPALVDPRIKAMFRLSRALRPDDANEYLQSKRYSQFFVFISHNLKPANRSLVENIYALLKKSHISPFEYNEVNAAGLDWKTALDESLRKTTHFVALLSPDYEQSEMCTYELDAMLARGGEVAIFPFLINGRDRYNPRLAQKHNKLLSSPDPLANADEVVREITGALDSALARADQG